MTALRDWLDGLVAGRTLGRGVRAVLDAAVADPEMCAYASAHAVARTAGVNPATVVRAAQVVGFGGWPEFAAELRGRYLSSLSADRIYERHREGGDDDGDPLHRTVHREVRLLRSMLAGTDGGAVRAMAEAVRSARRTIVFATGTYAAPGMQLAHVGQMLGLDVTVQNGAATAMLNSARLMGSGDCFVTFSLWRSSVIVREAAAIASGRGATVVAVVDRHSAVAGLADVVVTVPGDGFGFVPSITCAVAVVQTVLRVLADADPVTTRTRLAEIDELWESLGVVEEF